MHSHVPDRASEEEEAVMHARQPSTALQTGRRRLRGVLHQTKTNICTLHPRLWDFGYADSTLDEQQLDSNAVMGRRSQIIDLKSVLRMVGLIPVIKLTVMSDYTLNISCVVILPPYHILACMLFGLSHIK